MQLNGVPYVCCGFWETVPWVNPVTGGTGDGESVGVRPLVSVPPDIARHGHRICSTLTIAEK